jgi:hypothetical protein
MSEMLPNIDALLAELASDTPVMRDARALAEVARGASSPDELDAAIAAVVAAWRRC